MPSALNNFYKQQVSGPLNKIFLAGYIRDLATAENKWKAVFSLIKDIALVRILWPAALIGAFHSMGQAVRSILHDTGSLDAALRRMQTIQGLQRAFTPLLGGLSAAKQRVAELVAFTDRNRIFPLEDAAEASRRLEVFTRGTYSGTKALTEIQLASVQSGQGIVDVADAVGNFYADLRDGKPVDTASESLRQMGVISQDAANRLGRLQQAGASVQDVMGDLTSTIAGAKPEGAGEDLSTVQRRQEEAGKRLQEAFGKPFTGDEITSIKNYTDAMTAVTPVVGRVAGFFAILSDGLSTVKSTMAKAAAESPLLQRGFEIAAKGIGVVTAAAALFAVYAIPKALFGAASLVSGLTSLGRAAALAATGLRLVGLATGVGLAVAAIGTAIGVYINYRHQQQELEQQTRDLATAHREATAAFAEHMMAIQSLADRNELLAKSMQEIIELEQKRRALMSQPQTNILGKPTAAAEQLKDTDVAIGERKQQQKQLLDQGISGLTAPEREAFISEQVERTRQTRRASFETALTRQAPEGRESIMRAQEADLREQERQAEAGIKARKDFEERRAEATGKLVQAQTEQGQAGERIQGLQGQRSKAIEAVHAAEVSGGDVEAEKKNLSEIENGIRQQNTAFKEAGKKIEAAQGDKARAGLPAAKDSSVFAEEMERRITYYQQAKIAAKIWDQVEEKRLKTLALTGATPEQQQEIARSTPQDAFNYQYYAAQQRGIEQNLPGISAEAGGVQAERERTTRQLNFQRTEEDLELEAHRLRRTGNSQLAEELDDRRGLNDRFKSNVEAGMPAVRMAPATTEDVAADTERKKRDYEVTQEKYAGLLRTPIQAGETEEQRKATMDDLSKQVQEAYAATQKPLAVGAMIEKGPGEAVERAQKGAMDDIAESAQKIPPVIADSLQQIGGGGASYGPSGDPMLRVAERQRKLLEESKELLKKIADGGNMGVK